MNADKIKIKTPMDRVNTIKMVALTEYSESVILETFLVFCRLFGFLFFIGVYRRSSAAQLMFLGS